MSSLNLLREHRSLADSLFNGLRLVDELGKTPQNDFVKPRTDIQTTEIGWRVSFDLPGFDKQDIEIETGEGVLTVTAKKTDEDQKQGQSPFLLRERYRGGLKRHLQLPETANVDDIQAHFKNGVLTLDIGKKPEAKPRKIAINISEQDTH